MVNPEHEKTTVFNPKIINEILSVCFKLNTWVFNLSLNLILKFKLEKSNYEMYLINYYNIRLVYYTRDQFSNFLIYNTPDLINLNISIKLSI